MPKFLKNKHIIIALIVAPILALISFFATDYIVSERPHKAVKGSVYPLNVTSSCRWQSGQCGLQNNDVDLMLKGRWQITSSVLSLHLSSNIALEQVKIAFSNDQNLPKDMMPKDGFKKKWTTSFNKSEKSEKLNIAVTTKDITFIAQFPALFLDPHPDPILNR